jgi:transposase
VAGSSTAVSRHLGRSRAGGLSVSCRYGERRPARTVAYDGGTLRITAQGRSRGHDRPRGREVSTLGSRNTLRLRGSCPILIVTGAPPLTQLDAVRAAVHVASASPYEPHLVPATLDARFLADLPTRLIGDRGYDSDALDETLMTTYGIEMIAAHRRGRRHITQDGRCLRRARRRWKIERLFAWLHNFRRLVTRWERHVDNFVAMLHLACARILLRCYEMTSRGETAARRQLRS